MAEALLRAQVSGRVRVRSAGLGALVGKGADPLAVKLMDGCKIDIGEHVARQITPEMIREYDLILVMDKEQQQRLHSIAPASRGRVHLLGKWSDLEVPDTYRKSPEYFEHVLVLIEKGVSDWAKRL